MGLFRKRPVEVVAERHYTPFTVETKEGAMQGNPGDWLVTGVDGEKYPVAHSIFIATYDPVDEIASAEMQSERASTPSTEDVGTDEAS